jgi:hypothetical protein
MPSCDGDPHSTTLSQFEIKGIPAALVEAAVLTEILEQVIADRVAKGKACGGDCYHKDTEECKVAISMSVYRDKVQDKLWTRTYFVGKKLLTVDVKLEPAEAARIVVGSDCGCYPREQRKQWF